MVSPHHSLDNSCKVLFVVVILMYTLPVLLFLLFQFSTHSSNDSPRHSELNTVLNRLLLVKEIRRKKNHKISVQWQIKAQHSKATVLANMLSLHRSF